MRLLTVSFLMLIGWTGVFGQTSADLFRIKQNEGTDAFKKKDFDRALVLYSEAIDSFPKADAFTPLPKESTPGEDRLAPPEFRGLENLYLARFWVHLAKNDSDSAQADLNRSLIVLDKEKKRELDRARSLRSSVNLEIERKIPDPSSHNSDLIRAGFMFNIIGQSCSRIRNSYTYKPKKDFGPTIPQRFLSDKDAASLLSAIEKTCETAKLGEAESFTMSAIELNNRARTFQALKLANELVQRYPQNVEAYRLRSKVNRAMGNEQQALHDDQKVKDLSLAN